MGNCIGPVTAVVADVLPVLRILLNDLNPSVQEFPDATLTQGVKSLLLLNQMPGYALSPDQTTIQPPFPNADGFALVCFKTARLFVAGQPDRYEFRSRAFTEKIGSYRDFIMNLDKYIYDLEDGCMFSGWQMFYGFLAGISGLSLLEVFTSMKVNSPFFSVTLTATGGTAAS